MLVSATPVSVKVSPPSSSVISSATSVIVTEIGHGPEVPPSFVAVTKMSSCGSLSKSSPDPSERTKTPSTIAKGLSLTGCPKASASSYAIGAPYWSRIGRLKMGLPASAFSAIELERIASGAQTSFTSSVVSSDWAGLVPICFVTRVSGNSSDTVLCLEDDVAIWALRSIVAAGV